MKKTVLKVENVGMKFNLMERKVDNLKEFVIKMIKNELRYQEFWALKNVSFSLETGDRLGILGLNGAGKSTLLKIIAGVLKATEGKVSLKGKIVPLLELGAGFDPQYTGMENVFLYGAMLGYPKELMKEKYNAIVEFSELDNFIHVPVKNYSSGMKARLGFSIATVMEPDILILDEVLSVGDAKFRKKSEKRIQEMFDRGVTVLFVSHSIEQVMRICNKAIILDHGTLIAEGEVKEVAKVYSKMIGEPIKKKKKKKKKKAVPVEESIPVSAEIEKAPVSSETGAVPVSLETEKAPVSSEIGVVPVSLETEKAPVSSETGVDLISRETEEAPVSSEMGVDIISLEAEEDPVSSETEVDIRSLEAEAAPVFKETGAMDSGITEEEQTREPKPIQEQNQIQNEECGMELGRTEPEASEDRSGS